MTRYEHLRIYKAALDLTVHLEKLVAGFSRYHKYTLGTEMRERSRAVLMQVLRANNAANAQQRRVSAVLATGKKVTVLSQQDRAGGAIMQRLPLARWVGFNGPHPK